MKFNCLFTLITLFVFHYTSAQIDSVRFINGQLLVGEIQSLQRGVLTIETHYSDSDFEAEWKKVIWIRTQSNFIIDIEGGEEFFSNIYSINDSLVRAINPMGLEDVFPISDIVFLRPFDSSFKDRLSAFIDVSYEMAKAKNLKRFTTRVGVGYQTEKWTSNLTLSSLQSTQDDADDIRRTESELNFRYLMGHSWYSILTVNTLSNNEQLLDLRLNTQLGMARFLYRTNKAYWGVIIGANRNIEKYSDADSDRRTYEGYGTMELNLYDVEDFSLLLSTTVYAGITEQGRWRSDTKLDIKYDLPLDFYIRFGATLNYDNKPIEGVSTTDYIVQTGFGWEW